MAISTIHIDRTAEWRAGAGTPLKYSFRLNADLELISYTAYSAKLRLVGWVGVQNYPYQSMNSFAASDFAVLSMGNIHVPTNYSFLPNTYYYQAGLPMLPRATATDGLGSVLIEFRGDTWRSAGANKVSLYTADQGLRLNVYAGSDYQQFNIDMTYEIAVSNGVADALEWTLSGADNSTTYTWFQDEIWATYTQFDYIPGKIWDGSQWLSHNRSGGDARIYTSASTSNQMRTISGGDATDNPPLIYYNASTAKNMRKIGAE